MQQIKSGNQLIIVGLEILLALLVGFGLAALGAGGGAWILGGIVAGALVIYGDRVFYQHEIKPNPTARKIGQAIVGLTIGFSIEHSNLAGLYSQIHIFGLLTLSIIISGYSIGYIYSRIGRVDLLTAILATVPGNIGVMASIAADYGSNVSLVSLVQLIRFTTVILVIPLLAKAPHLHAPNITAFLPSKDVFNLSYLLLLLLLVLLTLGVLRICNKLSIPAASFLGAIIVGLSFNWLLSWVPFITDFDFNLPTIINLIGQVLLGITIGEYWGINPNLGKGTILYACIPVALTFAAGLIAAEMAMLLTNWDWVTCLLVTAPGGSPEMILISLVLNRNVEIVTAGHLVRLISINLSLPVLVSVSRHIENRLRRLAEIRP